jgi:hypothetical protein
MKDRRASRPAAAINSEMARDKSIVLPLNSQRFPSENSSLSHRSLLNLEQLGDESPAEHIRNALQLLRATLASGADARKLDAACYDASTIVEIEQRLTAALAQLTPLAADFPAADRQTCVHCGCSDHAACSIALEALTPAELQVLAIYYTENGRDIPNPTPCWWISEDPPVCSNPHCVELHNARSGVTV